MVKEFHDLGGIGEDERIQYIGRQILNHKHDGDRPFVGGIVVEDVEKAERYKNKLLMFFPTLRIIEIMKNTPTQGMVTLKVGQPLH